MQIVFDKLSVDKTWLGQLELSINQDNVMSTFHYPQLISSQLVAYLQFAVNELGACKIKN